MCTVRLKHVILIAKIQCPKLLLLVKFDIPISAIST
jgi:hypothetical protein